MIGGGVDTFVGIARVDLMFSGCRSLKDRRGHLNSLRDRLRHMGLVSAQVGPADIPDRAWLSVACVSGNESTARNLLERAIDLLSGSPEWEVLELRSEVLGIGDD